MQILRNIRLYGALGARFGRVHKLAVASVSEAMRALSVLLPGFEQELMQSRDRGVGYAVFHGKRNISSDELHHPTGCDIRIAPMLTGSKRGGLFQIVLGAVLIAASFVPGLSAFAPVLLHMGLAMVMGGVVQMLSPQATGLGTGDTGDNGASYNFNGAVNTQAQGNPVPLLYGRMIVGSSVISAGIYAEDQT